MGIFKRRAPHDDGQEASDLALEAEVETVLAVHAIGRGRGDIFWGAPSRCPDCGVYGFVEDVDHGRGVTSNRCLSNDCRNEWVITRRALRELKRRLASGAVAAAAPVGAGIEGSVPIPTDSPLYTSADGGRGRSNRVTAPESPRDPLDRFDEPLPDPPRIDAARADDLAGDPPPRRRFGGHRIA